MVVPGRQLLASRQWVFLELRCQDARCAVYPDLLLISLSYRMKCGTHSAPRDSLIFVVSPLSYDTCTRKQHRCQQVQVQFKVVPEWFVSFKTAPPPPPPSPIRKMFFGAYLFTSCENNDWWPGLLLRYSRSKTSWRCTRFWQYHNNAQLDAHLTYGCHPINLFRKPYETRKTCIYVALHPGTHSCVW